MTGGDAQSSNNTQLAMNVKPDSAQTWKSYFVWGLPETKIVSILLDD